MIVVEEHLLESLITVHHHLGGVAADCRSLPIVTLLIALHTALYRLPVETQLLYKHTVDTYAEIQGYQGNFTFHTCT